MLIKAYVRFYAPDWEYCDKKAGMSGKYKSNERCQFCKEVKLRGQAPRYFCALHNEELRTIGTMVEKTEQCTWNWKYSEIIDRTNEPPREDLIAAVLYKTVKQTLSRISAQAKALIRRGIPAAEAYDTTIQLIKDEWK